MCQCHYLRGMNQREINKMSESERAFALRAARGRRGNAKEGIMETWTTLRAALPAGLTEDQLETIRRVGARRRHAARVEAAKAEIASIMDAIMLPDTERIDRDAVERIVRPAIRAALGCIGTPGSSCGSAPPGWYPGGTHVHARIAAMEMALDDLPPPQVRVIDYQAAGVGNWDTDGSVEQEHADGAYVTASGPDATSSNGTVCVLRRDERAIAAIDSAAMPTLAEHVLDLAIRPAAERMDAWMRVQAGEQLPFSTRVPAYAVGDPMPEPPDAGACAEYARLVAARHERADACGARPG